MCRISKSWLLLGIAGLLVALVLPACADEPQEVNLYSARKEALIKPVLDQFSAETGIQVNLVTGKAATLLQRLISEGANSPADLLLTTDAAYLQRAVQADLLQPVESEALQQHVPYQYQEAKLRWYGLTMRARPILYVKEKVDPAELSSYEALVNRKWKGRICIRSSNNAYNQSLVASMIVAHGVATTETWARGLVANFARPPKGGDRDQIRAAAAGLCDIVIANTYYLGMMLNDKDPAQREAAKKLAIFWPNQKGRGTHVNLSGIGLLRSAKHPEPAKRLMRYLFSKPAQQWFTEHNYEYPIRSDVPANDTLLQWGPFKADPLHVWRLGEQNAEAVRLMDRAGWR